MVVSYQSHEGHTTLRDLSEAEVDAKFAELTERGFRGFASTSLAEPVGPLKTADEARKLEAEEIYFIAPLQGG